MATASATASRPTVQAVPMSPSGFIRNIGTYLKPHWPRCLLILGLVLAQVAFYLFMPWAYKLIFDRAIGQSDAGFLKYILTLLGAGFLLVTLAELVQAYVTAGLGAQVMNDIRGHMFHHLQRLPMGFYARTRVGDLMSRFSNDLTVVDHGVTYALYKVTFYLFLILFSAVLLFFIEWRLALITMLALPLGLVGPKIFGPRASRAGYDRKTEEAGVASLVQENINAQKVIRAFGLQQKFTASFYNQLNTLYNTSVRLNVFSAFMGKTSGLGIICVQLLVIAVGAYLSIEGYLTAGSLVGFVGLLINVGNSANALNGVVPDLIQAAGGLQRIEEFLQEKSEDTGNGKPLALPRLSKEIRFEDVSFSYTGDQVNLDNVSFTIPAGQSVVFVGRSGSGKSTVLHLLTRFYQSGKGHIVVDGQDLKEISQDAFLSQVGTVFQDTYLFNDTIRENIRLGKLDATDAELEEAAKAAEIHDLIQSMPQGYDTGVGEMGGRLSGGQRQRIALARAILRNPSILILDEATSALDPATEAAINATLERLSKERTLISVTHRLSSAMNMDCIFVLDNGKLVEQGSHRQLLNLKGMYHEMWQEFTLELTQEALVGGVEEAVEQEEASDEIEDLTQLRLRLREARTELSRRNQEVQRLEAINHRWAQLAGTDSLTGLPNKIAFVQALVPQEIQQAQRNGDPIGFLLISGDNLGPINETYGRDAGDQVIRGMSELLQSVLKGEEQLGHIDGTHFSVVLHPATLEQATARAEEIRRRVETHKFPCADTEIQTSISAGVLSVDSAAISDPKEASEHAFRALNRAVYLAKKTGGNRVEAIRGSS